MLYRIVYTARNLFYTQVLGFFRAQHLDSFKVYIEVLNSPPVQLRIFHTDPRSLVRLSLRILIYYFRTLSTRYFKSRLSLGYPDNRRRLLRWGKHETDP